MISQNEIEWRFISDPIEIIFTESSVRIKYKYNNNDYIYNYKDVLLLPSTLRIILLQRGELCHKHINSVIKKYIEDKVENTDTSLDKYLYLVLFASDFDDNLNIVGYRTEITPGGIIKPVVKINKQDAENNIDKLYDTVVNVLS